jgi:hypothetical protein
MRRCHRLFTVKRFIWPFLSHSRGVCRDLNFEGFIKSHKSDGTVKSSRRKARESLGMRHTYQYAAVTKDEAQRRRWTFYEAVNVESFYYV